MADTEISAEKAVVCNRKRVKADVLTSWFMLALCTVIILMDWIAVVYCANQYCVSNPVERHSNHSSNVVMKYILYITVKQNRQRMYNVTLWHAHVTSVTKAT
jgi:hypothetical protein